MDSALGRWVRRGVGFGVGLVIVVAVVLALTEAAAVVALVFVAILFGSAIRPLVDAIRSRAPFGRTAATGLLFVLGAAVLVGLGAIIVTTALAQVDEIGARVPSMINSARRSVGQAPGPIASTVDALLDQLDRTLDSGGTPTPDQVLGAGSIVAGVLGAFSTLATLVFFWVHERARLQRFILAFLPLERRGGARRAWNDVEDRLGRWVRAQLLLMGIMALATGVAYSLLGLPAALVLGLAAGLLEAVPIVGPLLGAIPAVLVAATVRPELILAVVAVYAVVQLTEANVLVPLVMSNSLGLSPFIVLVAVLFGAVLGGPIGAYLAIPIAASAEIILERLQAREVPVALEPEASPSAA